MLDIDFSTSRYKVVPIPQNEEGYTHAILTLDPQDNVLVFASTTNKESADKICKEMNGGHLETGPS